VRVLYFSRGFTPHDHRFLSALAETDHELYFLQLENSLQSDDRPVPEKINQIFWHHESAVVNWMGMIALRRSLMRIIRKVQPDLIHAGPVQHSAFLTALAGFHPLVTMSWGSDLLKDAHQNKLWHWITRYTLQRSDILVADCDAVASEAAAFGFSREKIILFPWGVDLVHFKPGQSEQLRQRLGWQDCFVLISLRSWEALYGVDHLVKGFILAAQKHPDLRLMLLGAGSQASQLRGMLLEAGLSDRVHFGGRINQSDLPRYYQAADLYLSASHSDGSSVSLMEALACGLPVLVSDIPGNREWIQEGVQGWLFPDGDEAAIAQKIGQTYQMRNQIEKIRQAGRALAEQRADWQQNFQKLLYAYDLAVNKGENEG
jgi:glycosyltransferase involved in cell wall biosynthesis